MSDDSIETSVSYETQTVKALRGTEARTIAKWEAEGWEVVSQQTGPLRTEMTIRRPKKSVPWRFLGIGGALAVLLLSVFVILGATGVFGDDESREAAPATSSATAAPPANTPEAGASTAPLEDQEADPVGAILTVSTNADLAALLTMTDYCAPTIGTFANTYSGRMIFFDGNISALTQHGDTTTRYDILIGAGDYIETTSIGPAFQFNDVNTTFDMHYEGDVPGSIGVGTNLIVTAEVGEFDENTCLLQLSPVQTVIR